MKKCILLLIVLSVLPVRVFSANGVSLNNIRFYAYPDYTRVVLDLSGSLKVNEKILPGKDLSRLYFDLHGCLFARSFPKEKNREILIKSGNLKKIRLGVRDKRTIRVVFDFDKIGKYDKFYLTSPFRVVFDIFKQEDVAPKGAAGVNEVEPTKPPEKIGDQYSMIRQLGLGVHRIIVDPGHGGKDPGTFNRHLGLYEKTLVLDIAKRLKKVFEQNSKYQIVLTRDSDRYISLEERTAIANSQKGDLFVSIHLNSSPRKHVRGVETFYLNITTDPWAINVAAMENAVGLKSIGEMSTIVEKIVKNTKKSESKILCQFIQKGLVDNLNHKYSRIVSLGVKKAPFYVLVGARMPAALVEASFLSNSQEAKRLRSQNYRDQIARGLYSGIIAYIKSLGKQ
jgi:N-acetylmuramoyl-L-alanine amidase